MCHSNCPYTPGWKKWRRSHHALILHFCSSYFFLPHCWTSTGLDPLSLERQNGALPALPGSLRFPHSTGICSHRSTSVTRVGDALGKHADEWFCKSYCHRGLCDKLKAEKKMLHTSTVPCCAARVLWSRNFHHHSNNLQLSKGLPIQGLVSDILEQIRIGSNISQYT